MKKYTLFVITCLLLVLFTYTAASKLLGYERFVLELRNQPLPRQWKTVLSWMIPCTELLVSFFLFFPKTRLLGFVMSFLLLLGFTTYTGLVLLNYFDRIPCSCGGIIKQLNWTQHLVFNIIFTMLAGYGWLLQRKIFMHKTGEAENL